MKHGDHNLENILIAEHLKKSFGSIEAVRDVSFHVRKGEVLGIIGPNGAGKTTIFNLISKSKSGYCEDLSICKIFFISFNNRAY
jgi:ABC-type branched-subunit amino acid transport system ATPase component